MLRRVLTARPSVSCATAIAKPICAAWEIICRGQLLHGGWDELIAPPMSGALAFRFETTEEQDDIFIALMNDRVNRSHFTCFQQQLRGLFAFRSQCVLSRRLPAQRLSGRSMTTPSRSFTNWIAMPQAS